MKEEVILVDDSDLVIGSMEKMEAHQKGLLHRAFSVFVFNSKGELLLQKRAMEKYHSGGLWTNTCCGHPRPTENLMEAAKRRLQEEMGIKCDLEEIFSFKYLAHLDNDLKEDELDHILIGHFDGDPLPDQLEASEWRYETPREIMKEVALQPNDFTVWFKMSIDKVLSTLKHES